MHALKHAIKANRKGIGFICQLLTDFGKFNFNTLLLLRLSER